MCKLTLGLLLTLLAVDLGLTAGAPEQARSHRPRPAAGLRDPGPDVVLIDELANLYGPVVFDHGGHVSMCEFGGRCDNCHHGSTAGREISACRTCHGRDDTEIREQPSLKGAYHRQCLGCHRAWSHENACGFCHVEAAAGVDRSRREVDRLVFASSAHLRLLPTFTYRTTRPGAPVVTFHHADHSELFGLSCIDCHDGASCDECHGPAPDPPVASREDLCFKCHAGHRCIACHDVAPRGRFEHTTATGWNLGPGHQDLSCSKCHGDAATFSSPSSDKCRSCHRGGSSRPFDHAITGVPMLGSHAFFDCVQCHHGGGSEAAASCDRCHGDRGYPRFLPGFQDISSSLLGPGTPDDGALERGSQVEGK